jgi:hypothetical protein
VAAAGTQTSISRATAVGALQAAGAPPGGLSIIAAMSAYETAGWQGGLWNWNFGNITTSSPNYVLLPGNSLHFAAYPSMAAGAKAFIDYLRSHGLLNVSSNLAAFVDRLEKIPYAGTPCTSPGVPPKCQDYSAYQAGIALWQSRLIDVVPATPISSRAVAIGAVGGAAGLAVAIRFGWIDRIGAWIATRV